MIRFIRNIFILLIILLSAGWLLLQYEPIQQKIIAKLEDTFFKATGLHFEMSHVSISLPGTIAAYDIHLRNQSNQSFLESDRADLTIDVAQLLKWKIPKLAFNLHHAKLHTIPEHLVKERESDPNTPEILLRVINLEIGPNVFTKIDLPPTIELNSLILKNVLFRSSTNELSGEVYAKGNLESKALNLEATFKRLEDRTLLADFQVLYHDILPLSGKLNLSPTMNLDGTTFQIPLTTIASLESLIEKANDYEGIFQVDGDLYGSVTAPLIDMEIRAPSVKTNDVSINNLFTRIISTVNNKELAGQIDLSSLVNDKALLLNADFNYLLGEKLTINSSELHFDDLALANLVIQTTFPHPNKYPFAINTEGTWDQTLITLAAEGVWQNSDDAWQLNFQSLSGVAILPFKLLEPTTITKNSRLLTIESLSMEIAAAKATGSLTYDMQDIQGSLTLQNLSLDSLPLQWMTQPAEGMISLKATILGAIKNPKVQLSVSAQDFFIKDEAYALIKPGIGTLSALIENNLFSGNGSLTTPGLPSVDFRLQFPLAFSLDPWVFNIDKEGPLAGNLITEGEIAQVLLQLLDNPTSFSGNGKVHLNIGGTLKEPKWEGNFNISKGTYEIPEIGVLLTDLSAAITIQGPRLLINQMMASDGKGGKLFGTGYYDINKEQNNPFVLEMTLQEATLLNQDYVQIICNGPLTFKGNSEEGALAGQLQVSNASVTIPERSYSTINTVDVGYVNIPKDHPQPQSLIRKKTSWPLALDIHLDIPRSLTIQGKDLTSNWGGEIAVQGAANAPLLFGELRITDGQYLFNGNPFAINQGTITFAGDLDKKTTIYVIAQKDLDKVKVDVIVKGPVKNPAISFRSNPPLPQREILSWLLFNRGTSQISPFQGAQLSESITNLSTNQQGPDVLSKIRSTFKIDRFEIGRNPNNANTGVNIEVGKYISDNILISVIKSDVNKIAVEANLTDKIKLQAQVGDDSQGKLLLKWKRDY